MKKYLNFLSSRRTSNILVVLIILSFIIFSLIRLYPFENTLKEVIIGIDDWNRYARFGLDIKHNGILIPSANGIYEGPGGFFYNYFIALCFSVFGENIIPIYIIQSTLLGFSVAFIYWAFRDKMNTMTGFAFLFTIFIFALFDVYKYYTFKLLSENLGIFTVSLFIYFSIKGIEKNKLSLQICASVFLTLSILTRPVIFPFGIAFIVILLFYFLKYKKKEILKAVLLTFIIATGMSLLAIRNYLICGDWIILPTLGISDSLHQTNDFSIVYFLKKILFCFGYLPALEPEYHIRPHWIVMWIGYFIYIFYRIKTNCKIEIWEVLVQLFIIFYYSLSIIFVLIDSYGFRAFIPVTFIILAFSFMGLDKLLLQMFANKKGTYIPFL